MSWIKFELKEEHIKMIKAIEWDENIGNLFSMDEKSTPFGGDNLIDDLGLIFYGLPDKPFDPNSEVRTTYKPEEVSEMLSLYVDLPIALELTTFIGSFELGKYKRRFKKKDWILQKKKEE